MTLFFHDAFYRFWHDVLLLSLNLNFFSPIVPLTLPLRHPLAAALLALTFLSACQNQTKRETVDLLVTNATVYTVDSTFRQGRSLCCEGWQICGRGPGRRAQGASTRQRRK